MRCVAGCPCCAARATLLGMTATAPSASDRAHHVSLPDDEEAARWAAFFESLPAEEREGLDELGREIGARLSKR